MDFNIAFLCGARDYHAIDWYKTISKLTNNRIILVTDLISGEGYKQLINSDDLIYKLVILDKFLFKTESRLGNYWRNVLKFIIFPIQVILICNFKRKNPNTIYHAHSMYYMWLAWASKIPYVGTPQGSDILIKPNRSKLYKFFTVLALKNAKAITVDSHEMRNEIFKISSVDSRIIQNGIDTELIMCGKYLNNRIREYYTSIRGFTKLYRINFLVEARNKSLDNNIPLTFVYPFKDEIYRLDVQYNLIKNDLDLGRLTRIQLYDLLSNSRAVFSIPSSDSSPRSVYEAIFCGCVVVCTYNPYLENLSENLRKRIVIIDISSNNWFDQCIEEVENIYLNDFQPTLDDITKFSQTENSKIMYEILKNSISNIF